MVAELYKSPEGVIDFGLVICIASRNTLNPTCNLEAGLENCPQRAEKSSIERAFSSLALCLFALNHFQP